LRLRCLSTVAVLYEMSKLLSTGLTRDQLTICIQLVEAGMDPETLAAVVKELKREAASMQRYR
jgi:mitotic-spindle organizing protein 1